jgi:Rrf2 family protein
MSRLANVVFVRILKAERAISEPTISVRREKYQNMLTNKAKYGLKAAMYLCENIDAEYALVADISKHKNIPHKFLNTILIKLRVHGYTKSKKGFNGGYALARRPEDISVGDIVRVLDGPFAPTLCASRDCYKPCDDCVDINRCRVRLAMVKVGDAISEVLDSMTLIDMANLRPDKNGDLDLAPRADIHLS